MSQGLLRALLDAGVVEKSLLTALDAYPPYQGLSWAERLYRSGVVSDGALRDALVKLGAKDATERLVAAAPPPAALGALSKDLAQRFNAIGLEVKKSRLTLGMLDPSDTAAIEEISFFTSLVVEPCVVRAAVLYARLAEAYGLPDRRPEGAFLATARPGVDGDAIDIDVSLEDPLPAPQAPRSALGPLPPRASASSPLQQTFQALTGELEFEITEPERPNLFARADGALGSLRDRSPATSHAARKDDALAAIAKNLPPKTARDARDSLPPQVLGLLVPPLRQAILFLVRGHVAVGWDGKGPRADRARVRDVLLPLTAPSILQAALEDKQVVVSGVLDTAPPTTTERMLFRFLEVMPPTSAAVVPIVVGSDVQALLYIDLDTGALDEATVDLARRVGGALGDGLAPFVAAGRLFPSVR